MAEQSSGARQASPDFSRRGLLAAGAVAAVAAVAPAAGTDDEKKGERTFEGESKDGKLQDALDKAMMQLDKALGDGGVQDAQAMWKIAGVTGERGG